MPVLGLIFCALTILIWGVTFVNTKVLLADFNSFEILVIRFALAYAVLWAIKPRRFSVGGWRQELHFAAMGLSGVAAYQFLENWAIGCTNASNVAILVSACPMGTAILSSLVLGARVLSWRFLLGFVLAMSGIVLVCLGGIREFHFSPFGDFIAVCAMFCWSVYSVLITKANVKGFGPILAIRRTFFWALVLMLPFLPFHFDFDPTVNAARFAKGWNLFHLGFLGVFASAVAFCLWNKTCGILGTVRATCAIYASPAVTAVVAYFVLGESLTAMTGFGAVLTLLGVMTSSAAPAKGRRDDAKVMEICNLTEKLAGDILAKPLDSGEIVAEGKERATTYGLAR